MATMPGGDLPQAGHSVWVLDFVQERFHDMIPGDFEGTFIVAEDSETKEGLKAEEATCKSLVVLCFGSLEML